MKTSKRLFLPSDDFDNGLVRAQMAQKFVHGTGFCGWEENAVIDPAEIIGIRPDEVRQAISKEDESVIKRSVKL